ncbi:hypothetical protein [Brunnivagina elsteri]|uniref:PEP-CTERM sorting domain-containing protein n=1 Tax=Brunnivagina elsteri CCALA 953 TaxID=987040 RepID=A0A2A2TFL7_9CYAN|nr:hypothetical protein [Calothrix elsteri]PAX52428.1 hypothetical protein CK510_19405 [Calothrix elsteri CCALA 953]
MYKLGLTALASGGLTLLFLALQTSQATAQLSIQTTGEISGTLNYPFGVTTNNSTTRINTDSSGTYFRNTGTKSNPNLVPAYSSKFVQVKTNPDGSLNYFVDFYGLQFISRDGAIASQDLLSGELQTYNYQGRPTFPVKFQASVQDELSLQKAFFEGIVRDPKTGNLYQGKFEVTGQGPRYSDVYDGLRQRNGGDSPTVFDFKTDYDPKSGVKPTPALSSYKMTNVPLVRLTIKIPQGTQPIPPGGGTTGGGTTTNPTPPTPPISTPPITDISSNPTSPTTQPNVEFSSGQISSANPDNVISQAASEGQNKFALNPNKENISNEQSICSQNSVDCRRKPNASTKIGPRSRILMR